MQMLSLLSEEAHGSLIQLTKDSECSLDKSSVHVTKADDYLEVGTLSTVAEENNQIMREMNKCCLLFCRNPQH